MTNYLDSLIGRIDDPGLAASLRAAARTLRDAKEFGLVFERHLPEGVRLQNHPVRKGLAVQLREDRHGATFTVLKVAKGVAAVSGATEEGNPDLRDVPVEDLVVVRDFGDPIYPGLKLLGSLKRGADRPFHSVIKAENYHALETLLYAYEGRADCIYIDPPYNTGARDWKYNNDYVDGNDVWRHSRWLSFMEKRLSLAKRLLRPDSVLIVTIDEKEVHALGLLLRQVFPSAVVQMTTIVINPLGQARKQELARVDEYAFFVFLGNAGPARGPDDLLTEVKTTARASKVRWEWLLRGGTHSSRAERPNLFYPIFVDAGLGKIAQIGEPLSLAQDRHAVKAPPGLVLVWPLKTNGDEGNWRCSAAYLRELVNQGYAKVGAYDRKNDRYSMLYLGKAQIGRIAKGEIRVTGRDANGAVAVEGDSEQKRLVTVKTVWNRLSHRAGEHGSSLVKKLLPGREFPFPKSLYAVRDCLRVATGDKPDAVIIDFFSGSGTTAHATMLLNQEDGGTRTSVCVTNNEVSEEAAVKLMAQGVRPGDPEWEAMGIFEHITKPRVEAATTGFDLAGAELDGTYLDGEAMEQGFNENVAFFELTYEDRDAVSLGRAFQSVAPLLWLKAGGQGRVITDIPPDGWAVPGDATYGLLFDAQEWRPFVEAINGRPRCSQAFIVTNSTAVFQQIAAELPAGVEPTMLYEDYLSTFEINTAEDGAR